MNLLLFEPEDFLPDGTARVSGRRLRQLSEVLKATPGKICKAGVLDGDIGTAELLSIDGSSAVFRFRRTGSPPPPLDVTLLCALPRPLTFAKVLHSAVTCGVKRICFFHSAKVEKSYWQSSKLADGVIRDEAVLALEQCADTVMPEISFHRRFRNFFEDELPELISADAVRVFGAPSSADPLPVGLARRAKVVLAIGPEGGLNEFEENKLRECGFSGVTLGRRILRSEFAVNAFLSLLGACQTI